MVFKEKEKKDYIDAGNFSDWLSYFRKALARDEEIKVPCGECRACCTSSYFIQIRPDEKQALARIPKKLLFPAPRLPKGNVLLGFNENGYCPMFVDNQCSIYDYRPQTCRSYDCRVFPATGISVDDDKPLISEQANRWKFNFTTSRDNEQISALQTAAKFVDTFRSYFPSGFIPNNKTQIAVLAIKIYEVFLNTPLENKNGNNDVQIRKIVKKLLNDTKN